MAIRIQRKRTKGWKMPPNTGYVGRPTKWGNPYLVTEGGYTREAATELFRKFMEKCGGYVGNEEVIAQLRGKDLACWCPIGQPCHADVLLEIANKTE
jgi:hypothetical protein